MTIKVTMYQPVKKFVDGSFGFNVSHVHLLDGSTIAVDPVYGSIEVESKHISALTNAGWVVGSPPAATPTLDL